MSITNVDGLTRQVAAQLQDRLDNGIEMVGPDGAPVYANGVVAKRPLNVTELKNVAGALAQVKKLLAGDGEMDTAQRLRKEAVERARIGGAGFDKGLPGISTEPDKAIPK